MPPRVEPAPAPACAAERLWPIHLSTGASSVAYGALSLLLPLDGLASGGIFGAFVVPGMLAVGSALVNVPGALAVRRFGHRAVMTFGLAAAAAATSALAFAQTSVGLMALAALVCGVGQGIWGLARLIYLADTVALERRGRAIAPVAGVHRFGMLVGPALAGFAADAWGRGAVLFSAAGLTALSWLVVRTTLPSSAAEPRPSGDTPQNPLRMMVLVAREHGKVLLTAGAAMWALALLRSARLLLLPICGAVLGLDPSQLGMVKSLSAAADVTLFYPVGLAMDRLGRKWTAIPSLLLLALGVLIIAWADGYTMLVVGGIVAGVGNGIGSGINMTLAGDFAPEKHRAEFIGVWRLSSDAGAALSPFIMGGLAQWLVLSAAGTVTAALGLAGMLVMAYAVREPLGRK